MAGTTARSQQDVSGQRRTAPAPAAARLSTDRSGRGALPFTKMQGIGNDYIYVNGFEHHVAATKAPVAGAIEDALDTYLEWDVYRHH